jgi:hypothetical protein
MDEHQRRKAANELVFREVNERIEKLQHRYAITDREPLQIVCECDRLECALVLSVSVDAYERARSDGRCFFVAVGHEDPAVEEIVDSGGDYLVVRKRLGEPARIAEENDPRG